MRAERWEPIEKIDGPIDHIDFSYTSGGDATVSLVSVEGRDSASTLVLRFTHVIVLAGEDEAPGGFIEAPSIPHLPRLERGRYPSWTFPLLRVFDSEALKRYQLMRHHPIAHFFLVSLENLVHVIASPEVRAAWR